MMVMVTIFLFYLDDNDSDDTLNGYLLITCKQGRIQDFGPGSGFRSVMEGWGWFLAHYAIIR